MRILTRYILRAHLGPFVFALSVLTGLLFVNTIARRFPDLAGKGLPPGVVLEVMALSLPHIVALTLPMAVLVAVLYAYSQLAADNEVTALKASGVNMLRLMVPLLGVAALLAALMLWFNDRVLPETNHDLKVLMADISGKTPTLLLKEQVVNEVRTQDYRTRYFIRPGEIHHESGRMKDVVIYDMSDPGVRRTVYADSGRMAFNRTMTDLFLTLYDGRVLEVRERERTGLQRVYFDRQVLAIRDVGTQLVRTREDEYRSDREMSLAVLQAHVDSARRELAGVRRDLRREAEAGLDRVLEGPAGSSELEAGGRASRDFRPAGAGTPDPVIGPAASEVRALANRAEHLRNRINQYQVEYHKKYAIPFACIIFVLIGAPLAVRFPRGGAGMVIAISLTIFGIYYMSLIGGETLGDDGKIAPFIGPWAPNILFGALALWALTRIGRETGTTRGGDWDDLWRTALATITKPFRRRRRAAPQPIEEGAD
ncbi:MAG TPA: LptF/LptG family permease [Longimicrobiales bacterium]|nr:LptF/LptG family permease [Longimicrobiales bacterium]